MDKKVLIISYYWPPAGGPGVQRWMKFVKYLPEYNIKPILYIPENPNYPIYDYSLNDEVSEKLEIIKNPITEISNIISNSKSLNLIRSGNIPNPKEQSLFQRLLFFIRGNLFIPDMKILWKNKSIDFIENYLSKTKIDVVITTGPPHSLHLIGYELKKRLKEEFGKCLWEKAQQRQRGKGTTEDLYWWYKKQVGMSTTPSELAIRLGRKTTKGLLPK